MGSLDTLDFRRLLASIPGPNPAGKALRTDFSPTSLYQRIKDARSAARAVERNMVWGDDRDSQTAGPRAEWKRLLDLAPQALAEESKDLEIAAWLTEALVREHGYAGLRDGFRLLRELSESFWEVLYPLPDEDGVATRLAAVAGLNGEESDGVLIAPIANVPVTVAGGCRALSLADYRRALDLERVSDPDKRAQRVQQGVVALNVFEQAVRESGREFYSGLFVDLDECCSEFDKLSAALDDKCGKDASGYAQAPPSSAIRSALDACRNDLRGIMRRIFGDEGNRESGVSGGDTAIVPVEGQPAEAVSVVRTREDAFRALLQVAEYFKRTEPHSPVAYALEQAVRWGRMSLPDLLSELIPDQGAREQIFKVVGIRPAEQEST